MVRLKGIVQSDILKSRDDLRQLGCDEGNAKGLMRARRVIGGEGSALHPPLHAAMTCARQ